MSKTVTSSRRRGGQPGNQNARGNRGNTSPRANRGNRGGRAPAGNANARRSPTSFHDLLLAEYSDQAEARAWIEANRDVLLSIDLGIRPDPADHAFFAGTTPEAFERNGLEYKLGLYVAPEVDPA